MNLTKNNLNTLLHLYSVCGSGEKEIKFNDIADAISLTKVSAKNNVSKLQAFGLINRENKYYYGDKMLYRFSLTKEGRELCRQHIA